MFIGGDGDTRRTRLGENGDSRQDMGFGAAEAAGRTDDGRRSGKDSDEDGLCSLGRTSGLDMAEQKTESC